MSFKLRKIESIAVILGTIVAIMVAIHQCMLEPPPPEPSKSQQPAFVEVSQITAAMEGITIDTRGIVTDLNENKSNVYFNLKDPNTGKEIRCVMFAKTNNDNPERKVMLLNSRDTNSVVKIKGEVDIYKGELELKVWQVFEADASNENTTSNEIVSFVEVSQINSSMKGMTKNTRGIVTILNENKGNVYFNLKDPTTSKEIRCVMFAKTNNDDPERKAMLLNSRDTKSVISLKGELELKVWQVYL